MKNERVLKNWQLHKMSSKYDGIEIKGQKVVPYIVTGTVVEDKFGKFRPGMHCRSSMATKVDLENNFIDTVTTTYTLVGEGDSDVVPEMGDAVLGLFY